MIGRVKERKRSLPRSVPWLRCFYNCFLLWGDEVSVMGEAAGEGEEPTLSHRLIRVTTWGGSNARVRCGSGLRRVGCEGCLLYTSDAADES